MVAAVVVWRWCGVSRWWAVAVGRGVWVPWERGPPFQTPFSPEGGPVAIFLAGVLRRLAGVWGAWVRVPWGRRPLCQSVDPNEGRTLAVFCFKLFLGEGSWRWGAVRLFSDVGASCDPALFWKAREEFVVCFGRWFVAD